MDIKYYWVKKPSVFLVLRITPINYNTLYTVVWENSLKSTYYRIIILRGDLMASDTFA